MRSHFVMSVVLGGLMAVTQGCGDDRNDPTAPNPMSIAIMIPKNGDAVPAGPLNVRVDVSGMMMDCGHMGGSHMEGSGHWQVDIDGTSMGMACGNDMMVDLTGMPPGPHTLTCSLMRNDHMAYGIDAAVSINVQGP